jgi:plasmid stabilization system protein ParE
LNAPGAPFRQVASGPRPTSSPSCAHGDDCTVIVEDDAALHLSEIDSWWRSNRPSAPNLFLDEFEQATLLLAAVPDIGPLFARSSVRGVRRLFLRRTRYWIYYLHGAVHAVVYVLEVWSTSRGAEPALREPAGRPK